MDDDCQSIPITGKFTDHKRSKTRCLIILLNAAAVCGLLDGMLPEDAVLSMYLKIFMALFLAFAVLVWCLLDAQENRITVSFRFSLLVVLVYPVGFVYYILKSRSNGRAMKTFGLSVLFLLLLVIFYAIAYVVGNFIYGRFYH